MEETEEAVLEGVVAVSGVPLDEAEKLGVESTEEEWKSSGEAYPSSPPAPVLPANSTPTPAPPDRIEVTSSRSLAPGSVEERGDRARGRRMEERPPPCPPPLPYCEGGIPRVEGV